MKKVLIIQQVMKQYREPLFQQLHQVLADKNIELVVAYSAASGDQKEKGDNIDLEAAVGGVEVPILSLFGGRLVFQQCLKQIFEADLIIVEQANRHLLNYFLMLLSFFKLKKFGFWGHGYNLQSDSGSWKEKIKKRLINTPDWWFAYTQMTTQYVQKCGVEKEKITNLNNSIDVAGFSKQLEAVTDKKIVDIKKKLQIPINAKVGLYCGAMYEEKKIALLLDALKEIKAKNEHFFFIFCGKGVDEKLVQDFCHEYSWCYYAGAVFGEQKAAFFKLADIVLNPGLVGLGILDCFAAGVPMVTTDYPKHSPEISYLDNGKNGLMVKEDHQYYAQAILDLLSDNDALEKLSQGALVSSKKFSIQNMANNFADGIEQVLLVAS